MVDGCKGKRIMLFALRYQLHCWGPFPFIRAAQRQNIIRYMVLIPQWAGINLCRSSQSGRDLRLMAHLSESSLVHIFVKKRARYVQQLHHSIRFLKSYVLGMNYIVYTPHQLNRLCSPLGYSTKTNSHSMQSRVNFTSRLEFNAHDFCEAWIWNRLL